MRSSSLDALKLTAGFKAALAHTHRRGSNRPGLAQMEQKSDARGQQQHQDHPPESSLV